MKGNENMSTNVKTNKTNKPILSEGAYKVLVAIQENALTEGIKPFTASGLKASRMTAYGELTLNVNSSHLTKLVNEGFINDLGIDKITCSECGSSRKVKFYELNEKGSKYTQ